MSRGHEFRYSYAPGSAVHPQASPSGDNVQVYFDGSPYYFDDTHAKEPPSFWTRQRKKLGTPGPLYSVGFALHSLLIGLHVTFAIVSAKGLERHVVIPLGKTSDRLSVILPAVTQAVWASYLAVMLLITQELALRKIFTRNQLLTATHDGLAAWSGVGSALLGLLRQLSLPSSVFNVSCVALYLVSANVLHITAPSLVTLVAANTTTVTNVSVTSALPTLSPLTAESHASSTGAAAGLLPVLGRSQVLATPGLDGDILYDVPVQESTTGVISVNLTVVDVRCGSIPDVKQIGRKSDLTWTIGANHSGSAFMFDLGLNATEANKYLSPNSLYMGLSLYDNPAHRFSNGSVYWPGASGAVRPVDFRFPVTTPDDIAIQFYGANFVFWSFVNVSDASGTNASYVPLTPGYPVTFTVKEGASTLGQGIQVIGCTLSTSQKTGSFDSDAKKLVQRPERRTSAEWKPWEPALYNDNKPGFALPTLDETLGMLMTGPLRDKSTIQDYLASQSGLPLTTYDASYDNAVQPALVQLHRFENALANATAAVLWTAARIGGIDDNALIGLKQGSSSATQVVPALRLNINMVPLITGLVASCILFLLYWIVTPLKSGAREVVTGAGMLQILWLFADSTAQRRVAKVPEDKVSLNELREAGMFKVIASGGGTVRRATIAGGND